MFYKRDVCIVNVIPILTENILPVWCQISLVWGLLSAIFAVTDLDLDLADSS